VEEENDFYRVQLESDDRATRVLVEARIAEDLPTDSVFQSLQEASEFFERGSVGFSPNNAECSCFDGLELHSLTWRVEPLRVERVESSFFEDEIVFPEGTARFDSALLMRGILHEWRSREPIRVASTPTNREGSGNRVSEWSSNKRSFVSLSPDGAIQPARKRRES
jgi:hypothetical protein